MPKAFLSNWVGGANPAISELLMDDTSLRVQNGVVTSHKLGAMLKRLGYSIVGTVAQANKSILGLFDFQQSPSVQKILLTMDDATGDDTQLFYNNAGTMTEITAAETAWANKASMKVEMESFIGYCFFVGYGATDGFLPVGSLTGTTFSTSTNVTDMPQAKYIIRYRDRLYVANLYDGGALPYRVGISDLPVGATLGWTEYQADTGWIDVDYSDEITGLGTNWDLLLMFTKRKTYYYDQNQKKLLWNRGCDAHRTIKNSGNYIFFANRDGVWMSQNGGEPQNIAGTVIDFIRNGTPANFFSEVIDEEYHMYVGTVTVDGVAYSNVDLIFNIATLSWRWEELTNNMTSYAVYDSSGDDRLYMGDTTGAVWNKSKYTDSTPVFTDSTVSGTGVSIPVNAETKPYFFDDPSVRKRLKRITVIADRALGVEMKMRVYDRNTRALSPYQKVGQLTKYLNVFEGSNREFNMLQFEFSEYSSNEYFSILGVIVEYELVSIPKISKK